LFKHIPTKRGGLVWTTLIIEPNYTDYEGVNV